MGREFSLVSFDGGINKRKCFNHLNILSNGAQPENKDKGEVHLRGNALGRNYYI